MTDVVPTPSRLWKQMTGEQRLRASLAFWQDDAAPEDHLQAALLVAERRKFRPKSVLALDGERRARYLASLPSLPDAIAARILVSYHLSGQRPMMCAFLDTLGIPHDDGLIREEAGAPDTSRLAAAAADLAERFPAGDVSLYLNTLLSQDPDTWAALARVPQREPAP